MSINDLLDTPPGGTPVPNLRPSHSRTLKDLFFYATAIAAIGGWLWKAARAQVDAGELENVKIEMRSALGKVNDRASALETIAAVTAVKVDTIKETLVRIEAAQPKKGTR